MRFTYKKIIEVSVDLDLPVVGYDIQKASDLITRSEVDYVFKEALSDSRSNMSYTVGDRKYWVDKRERLINADCWDDPGMTE